MIKRNKKKIYILGAICFILLIILLIVNAVDKKTYFKELKYKEVIEKMDNEESFVLLLSQTTCSHCMDFKPKIENVANKYKLNIYYIETNLLNKEETQKFKTYISYTGTPTTVFILNGKETTVANRLNGSVEEQKIIDKLKSNGFID